MQREITALYNDISHNTTIEAGKFDVKPPPSRRGGFTTATIHRKNEKSGKLLTLLGKILQKIM
jgi:hypothetical protein